jgi:CheY-like chemotaxis protein
MAEGSILIVDDSDIMCSLIKDQLIELGYHNLLCAGNGVEALTTLKSVKNIALVLSDLDMPIMPGMELLNKIKNDDSLSHIPVVMITGRVAKDIILEAMKIGACNYIEKPFDMEKLKMVVNKALSA